MNNYAISNCKVNINIDYAKINFIFNNVTKKDNLNINRIDLDNVDKSQTLEIKKFMIIYLILHLS